MSKPKLYGISSSRAFRSIWAAQELGLDYEHVPTSFRGDAQQPEYLAVNPNGRIPALQDGDFKLFESMAINMYLAKKTGSNLLPDDLMGESLTWQWSVWAISEIEPLQMQIVIQKFFVPPERRDEAVVERAGKGLARPLQVLDAHLGQQVYLLGDHFSLADLNLAGVMDLLAMVEFDLSSWPNVETWLTNCRARPSYASAKRVGVDSE
ncbi:MAG: glutathione S-transferase family protein [Pseudomonadota bacterium]